MTRWDVPIQVENLAEFRAYLVKRRVTMIVIHEANHASPKLLADYFHIDEREGLKQVRAPRGLAPRPLLSRQAAKFLIYRIDLENLREPGVITEKGIGRRDAPRYRWESGRRQEVIASLRDKREVNRALTFSRTGP